VQPSFTPAGATQPGGSAPDRRGSQSADRSRGAANRGGSREPRGWGALGGGFGVSIVLGSAVLGAVATLVKGHGPGSVLGLFIVAGTLVAALAVRPRAVRMLLPVPALCYVIAAVTTGLIVDPPSDPSKAALAVAAAQWIAAGFLTMVLATALAVVLTVVRWFLWHRGTRAPSGPGRSGRPGSRRKGRASREDFEDAEPYRPYETPVSFGNQGGTGTYGNQGGLASPGLGNTGGLGGHRPYGDTGGLGNQSGLGNTGGLGGQGPYGDTGGLGSQSPYRNTGGPAGQGPYGDTGGLGSQGPYRNTGGPAGQGPYGDTGGLGSQGRYGDTGGLAGQGRYGDAGGPGTLRRAGRWGDPGAPDPGGSVSWPEALQLQAL
jgi:hypothetical protein